MSPTFITIWILCGLLAIGILHLATYIEDERNRGQYLSNLRCPTPQEIFWHTLAALPGPIALLAVICIAGAVLSERLTRSNWWSTPICGKNK